MTYTAAEINDFMQKVSPEPNSGCWLWTGSINSSGYGIYYRNSKKDAAHRASWRLFNGDFRQDLLVCHKCDVPGCVNPNHLFLGTHTDNMRDAKSKGRLRRGSLFCLAVLSEEQIPIIREKLRYGVGVTDIAREYGVDTSAIVCIKTGESWSWIPDETEPYSAQELIEMSDYLKNCAGGMRGRQKIKSYRIMQASLVLRQAADAMEKVGQFTMSTYADFIASEPVENKP